MKNFETYIFDPEAVERSLPEIQSWHIDPIKQLENDEFDFLKLALEMEQAAIRKHQPNLQILSEVLGGYMRMNSGGSSVLADSIQTGFTLGKMVASKVYGVPVGAHKPTQKDPIIKRRLAVYHKDIEKDTLATIYEAETLPVAMILDAIATNTAEQTIRLRELIEFHLEIERPSAEAESAIALGAIVCYTVLSFERERTLEAALDKVWDGHKAPEMQEDRSVKEMLPMTPAYVRSEIEGLAKSRWYWPRLKRSGPAQTS